ncbi:DUF4123 domain-containing protein [Acinetobacter courvalinii]|uniref:DUF4123 domain-containing protein n=1 Tax=Acinetobacter courvalinii TaxID=280147 RepID=UPI0021D1A740|nr:DUF4123 domain-containing protein [Acinetobacter courvalinii]MCU4370211.1 DUF4123 domain-containing protein [Acinetobacter courvalinii]MCU4448416.1 DUF4123 domain-containing protein [Acinetobacter courvalinii]
MSLSIFTAIQYDTEQDHNAELAQQCLKLLGQYGHLIFLLDSTLNPSIFDDLVNTLAKKNIAYIPLAMKKDMATSNLFLVRIENQKVFEQVKDDLLRNLVRNKDITNDSYFVHGFGTTKTASLEELRDQIRNKLVVSDQERKILFRWYDPRVLIYLNDILEEKNLLSLLESFEAWSFLHPTGFYSIESSEERTQIQKVPLRSLNKEQSIALDLVEIANSVFQQLNDFKEVDISKLHPVEIHKTLLHAYQFYGLENNLDLVTYGLYGQIIHKDFMAHPVVTDILYAHCVQGELSFTDAMDYLDAELYSVIQQDLNV